MLTPALVRRTPDPLALLRLLGWPVAPIEVCTAEWRKAGIVIDWNGEASLSVVSRLRDFDLFLLNGDVPEDAVARFLRTYASHNLLTKSALLHVRGRHLSLFDLGSRRELRRADVDLEQPAAHAVDRLNLLSFTTEASLPALFHRALDREHLTRDFFLRFRAAVADTAEHLRESCTAESAEAVGAEALLLLSRLLFLSFVQVKGWLGGERRYLVDRLQRAIARKREFFSTVLLPLFFGCLNTPLSDRTAAAKRLGRIPYLNGGLFEPSAFELRNPSLHLPNGLLQRVLEEVFEKFDFSVDEGGAASTHVDPEMLGRVFESLMLDEERAASGSYYTPREIVDVLTERAIGEWLGDRPSLARLESITVLDPACGSGAFLLSALGVIERRWRELAARENVPVPDDLRQRIVERSLYGVDLKPEAVRLCELRLWLAIVSSSGATPETVRPLPNLDRNILQGNSLLSPTDFLGDGRGDVWREWMAALRAQRDLTERYRNAPRAERPALARLLRTNDQRLVCEMLAKSIERLERDLAVAAAPQFDLFGRSRALDLDRCRALQERLVTTRHALEKAEEGTLDFFAFDVHFAPVMANGGFDIVAGNPPWVRNSRIEVSARRRYADRFVLFRGGHDGTAFHQPDLSVAFFERALSLASKDGVVALLMPAKIANAAYAEPLRRFARERASVVELIDWSDDPKKFFDADTFPLGAIVRPRTEQREIRVTAAGESFTLTPDELAAAPEWQLVPPEIGAILRRLRTKHRALADVLDRRPLMGVKTGHNHAFFLDTRRVSGGCLVTTDGISIPLRAVCRCVRGRAVKRWSVGESEWMLWPPVSGWKPAPPWLVKLAKRRGVGVSSFRLSFVRPEHVGVKVAWKDLSRGMAAAVLPDLVTIDVHRVPLVPNQTLYSLDATSLDEAHALAALLNSTIAGALLVCTAEKAKDAHYRYFGRTVAAMPMPRLDVEPLARLSRRAHAGADVQDEIDCAVASLYHVTSDELAKLREFLARRTGG